MVVMCAHRGVSAELPQNSLPAFKRAIDLNADGIELDVHLSRDGVPVVMHDETVDATTNGQGPIAEKSVSELKLLDAGNGAQVPTLEEVLQITTGKIHVNIEVKAAAAGMAVLSLTKQFPSLEFAISSFNHDVLQEIHDANSEIALWPLASMVSDELFETATDLDATQLNLWDKMVNEEIIKDCADRGFGAWIWTVNFPERAKELVRWGVVGICTDDPATIAQAIAASAQ